MQLTIEDVDWRVEARPDEMPVHGNVLASGDDETDRQAEATVWDAMQRTDWAWCCVGVQGTFEGLQACENLGGCSYESEEQFLADEYYKDMQYEVLASLQKQLDAILERVKQCK